MSPVKGEGSKPGMSQGFEDGRRDWGPQAPQEGEEGDEGSDVYKRSQISDRSSQKLTARTLPSPTPSPLWRLLSLPGVLSRRICKAYRCCRPGKKECFIFFILRRSVTDVSFLMLANAFHLVCIVFCVCGVGVAF